MPMTLSFGQRLKNKRVSMGLSQKDLADLINMAPSHLSHIETGTRKPSYKNIYRICKILGDEFGFSLDEQHGGIVQLFHNLKESDKKLVMNMIVRLQPGRE